MIIFMLSVSNIDYRKLTNNSRILFFLDSLFYTLILNEIATEFKNR